MQGAAVFWAWASFVSFLSKAQPRGGGFNHNNVRRRLGNAFSTLGVTSCRKIATVDWLGCVLVLTCISELWRLNC